MSQLLQYNYAQLDPRTGECIATFTASYEIPLPEYILIPTYVNDYIGKYYSYTTDLWYEDSAMTIEAVEVNEMYHG